MAITLATHGFEESELNSPGEALKDAGALVFIVSPEINWGNRGRNA